MWLCRIWAVWWDGYALGEAVLDLCDNHFFFRNVRMLKSPIKHLGNRLRLCEDEKDVQSHSCLASEACPCQPCTSLYRMGFWTVPIFPVSPFCLCHRSNGL
eukprot:jgi/Botrbrau1/3312/Bobra.0048s0009.1